MTIQKGKIFNDKQKKSKLIKGKAHLPSETLGIKEYFRPEGKPAPPLPLRPDFLISSIIQSCPIARISLVLCQSPYCC